MPIAREQRFLITRDLGDYPFLGIESSMLAACIAEVRARNYQGVFGSPSFGFAETTLDFLRDMPDLRGVWFWDIKLKNIDALYGLAALEKFGVHDKRPPVDFSRLPTLRDVVWTPHPKDTGIGSLQHLDLLHVWHFKPKSSSFADLQLPGRVSELQINWANPVSLDGMSPIPSLRHLEIHRCRNLADIQAIPSQFPNLETLVVTTCGKLSGAASAAIAGRLPSLKHAYVQDRKLTTG